LPGAGHRPGLITPNYCDRMVAHLSIVTNAPGQLLKNLLLKRPGKTARHSNPDCRRQSAPLDLSSPINSYVFASN
jgi:hypothetical protein